MNTASKLWWTIGILAVFIQSCNLLNGKEGASPAAGDTESGKNSLSADDLSTTVKLVDVEVRIPKGFTITDKKAEKITVAYEKEKTTVELTFYGTAMRRPGVESLLGHAGGFEMSSRMLGQFQVRDFTFQDFSLVGPRKKMLWQWWHGARSDIALPDGSHLYVFIKTIVVESYNRDDRPKKMTKPALLTKLQEELPQTVLFQGTPLS
ncbi:MAG: hypothetical protein JXX14_07460, partial [Deltaproteobacteria bacterium]|nr:hypothetical protein [Deltaproteobacteria bacterium]